MPDATVLRIEDMESVNGGVMVRARAALGVTSFGMQFLNLPASFDEYPSHDESGTGQEEVYIPLQGSATLLVEGDEHTLEPGVCARVAPGTSRQIVPGEAGVQLLCLGGIPGRSFEINPWTELGAATPGSGEKSEAGAAA